MAVSLTAPAPKNRPDRLQAEIALLARWYVASGQMGADILSDLAGVSYTEGLMDDLSLMSALPPEMRQGRFQAGFLSYRFNGATRNLILYAPHTLDNRLTFFLSRAHEQFHVLQARNSAAWHMRVSRTADSGFMLSPRDHIRLGYLAEVDAFGKEILLGLCLLRNKPHLYSLLDRAVQTSMRDLQHVSTQASRAAQAGLVAHFGQVYMHSPAPDGGLVHDRYTARILDRLEAALAKGVLQQTAAYARMEDRDVLTLGQSLDLNPFAEHDGRLRMDFSALPPVSPANAARLAGINAVLGIRSDLLLPALGDVLAARGYDREGFLRHVWGTEQKFAPA